MLIVAIFMECQFLSYCVEPTYSPHSAAQSNPAKSSIDTVEVTGLRNTGYEVKKSATGNKTDTPIHDTPASVQVISEQLIQDQGLGQSINKLLLNISGVSANYGSATGNLPIVSMRGFDTGGFVLLDGIPQSLGSTFDLSSIEKIEVLKGPASVLYGSQHNVGGKINIITKKPTATKNAQWGVLTGSWDFYRTWMDFSGSLNKSATLNYRFDAAIDTAHSYRDLMYDKNNFIAPSLQWNFSDQDSLLLMGDNKQRNYRADPGLPTHFAADESAGVQCCIDYPSLSRTRRGLDLPINLYLGTDFNRSSDNAKHLRGEWEHQFDENWHLKFVNAHTWMRYSGRSGNFWWDPVKANDGSLVVDDFGHAQSTTKISGYSYVQRSHQRSTSADLTGQFTTGDLKHTALLGVTVDDELWRIPPGGLASYFTEDRVGQDDWLHPPHYNFQRDLNTPPSYASQNQKDAGIYLQDRIEINTAWQVLIGYRQGKTDGDFTWAPNDGKSPDIKGNAKIRGGMPRLGVVYEPNSTLALYASGSNSYNPNWGVLEGGGLLPPVQGKQFEIGLKQDIAHEKFNINVAMYKINKTNLAACAPNAPNCAWSILLGAQDSRGVEFDFNGALTSQFRLTSALTVQKAQVSADTIFWERPVSKGQEMYAVPHWIFNTYGIYSFSEKLQGLELGGGFYAASGTQANLPNDGFTLPVTRRLDLMLGYDVNSSLHWQLNVSNLTHQVNYSSSGWNLNLADNPLQYQCALTVKY